MKKLYFLLVVLMGFWSVSGQNIVFTDMNLKNMLVNSSPFSNIPVASDINDQPTAIDINNDGEIQVSEALLIYKLNFFATGFTNLTGIEMFTNLKYFSVLDYTLSSIDISNNLNLKNLSIACPSLLTLNLGNVELVNLSVNNSSLLSLDLSNTSTLKHLSVQDAPISAIDLSNQTLLLSFTASNLPITYLDFSNNLALTNITVQYTTLNP